MRPLANQSLLQAWDRGSSRNPLGRALAMLACAAPDRPAADLMSMAIAERDRELLQLRRAMFGDSLRGFVACEVCGASLEIQVQIDALLDRLEKARAEAATALMFPDCTLSVRRATCEDLAAAAAIPDPARARRVLLERCATLEPAASLEGEFEDAAVALFEALHRDSEIVFSLSCPECGGTQRSEFDIAQFLWKEVARAGASLLRDVHELASAYGWTEEAILAIGPARRACYLDMVRS